MAQPFDLRLLRPAGDSFPLSDLVASEGSRYASFAISDAGVLAYARGATNLQGAGQLRWYDRTGKVLGTLGDPGNYGSVALSPDERRVAVSLLGGSPPNRDIWIIDASRGVTSRLTFDPSLESDPVWSPDSARVVFLALGRRGQSGLRVKPAAGTADDEPLLAVADTANPTFPSDWSPDGRFIAYETLTTVVNRADVWILPLTGDKKPFPFVEGPGAQTNPATAAGLRTRRTSPERPRCTCSRSRRPAAVSRSRRSLAGSRCGAATARSCSSLRRGRSWPRPSTRHVDSRPVCRRPSSREAVSQV